MSSRLADYDLLFTHSWSNFIIMHAVTLIGIKLFSADIVTHRVGNQNSEAGSKMESI